MNWIKILYKIISLNFLDQFYIANNLLMNINNTIFNQSLRSVFLSLSNTTPYQVKRVKGVKGVKG